MTEYNYTVKSSKGDILTGFIDADNQENAVSNLKGMGYFIISVNKIKEDKINKIKNTKISFSFFERIKTKDLVIFTRQFSTLISSGMSLLESLTVLEKQTVNKKLVKIITEVRASVESGHSVSESLEEHKDIFSNLYISLVRAGEAGGVLDRTLNDLSDFLEREQEISAMIKSKTAYPKFIFVFAIVITFVIILFLVPTFEEIYADLGSELPSITQAVISFGRLLKNVYFYIILAVVIFGGRYLFKKFAKSDKGRHIIDKVKISLPKFGDLFTKMAFARFNRHFGVLLSTGVPILNSLEIAKGVADNVLVDEALEKVKMSIREGENISGPMSEMNIFPPMMVQMIGVGERTGTLDSIVSKVADFYDDEVKRGIEAVVALLEPMMLMLVALLVGTIVISMYLPMFNIYSAMQ
jgi:type IV pilus assembly protein PilC